MSDVISLGGVPLRDFEVPERVAFGGTQRVAVQQLIGGGRVVNVLGADDGEIAFGGVFSGADAAARAQALDTMRTEGGVQPLVWDAFFYSVVVVEFAADYAKPWWIPFSMRCVVTDDAVAEDVAMLTSAATLVARDVAVAVGFSAESGVSLAGLAATAGGLGAAQAAVKGTIATTGVALDEGVAGVAGAVDGPAAVAAVNRVVAASASLAALGAMTGFVNRAAGNLGQLL